MKIHRTDVERDAIRRLHPADVEALKLGHEQVQYDLRVDEEAGIREGAGTRDFNALRTSLQAAHQRAKQSFLECAQ
jgi:hypothetical protein